MEDIAAVEDFVQADIILYDIEIVDGSTIVELARKNVGKKSNTLRLLRSISNNFLVSKINALFKADPCQLCDHFFNKIGNLEQHLTTCKEKVTHNFQTEVYQLRETLVDIRN